MTSRQIPQDNGLPLLGHAIGFYNDMLGCAMQLQQRNQSNVVQTRLLNERPVILFGAEANQLVLFNRDGAFSSWGGWEKFIDKVFPGAIMSMDGEQHRYQRRIMQTAFKRPVLAGYLSVLNPAVEAHMQLWKQQPERRVYPSVKRLLLELAAPTFLGEEMDEEAGAILDNFVACVDATLALIRQPVPPFKMWKGVRARKKLANYFQSLMQKKRKTLSADFFSQFCHAESEEGEKYTDEEIIDHMIFLMMAAHDTTSSTLTTMIYNLGKHPKWQERLRDEVNAAPSYLAFEDLDKLEQVGWVMKESMRLFPPVPTLPRRTTREIEFDGYVLKKNQLVSVVPIHTHHDPELYPNPYVFDPERFSDERSEHKKHRYGYIPFGGGAHMCMGQHFAEMQVKVIMSHLLRNFTWAFDEQYTMPYAQVPIPSPKDGLPIKLIPIE